jgi:hypothetical protein
MMLLPEPGSGSRSQAARLPKADRDGSTERLRFAIIAGVRTAPPFAFRVLTGQQKFELYWLKKVAARCTHRSFEKQ